MERQTILDRARWLDIGIIAVAIIAALAIAWLPLIPLIILIGGTVIVLVTLIEPPVGLALTLVAAPLAAYTNFMTGAVLRPLDTGQIMLALTMGTWLLRGLARREIRIPAVPLLWPLIIFVAWAAISLLWAPSYEYAVPEVIKWAEIALVMLMVTDAAGKRRMGWVLAGVLVSGAFQAVVGIWQFGLRGTGPEAFRISSHYYRAYGSFEQPNPYAGYLGLIWPVAAGLSLLQITDCRHLHLRRSAAQVQVLRIASLESQISNLKSQASKSILPLASRLLPLVPRVTPFAVAGVSAILCITAIVLSWSRGAWMGALAALVVMAAVLPRRAWLGIGGVVVAVAVLLSANALGVLPGAIHARLTDFTQQVQVFDVRGAGINDANYAVLERLAHWQAAGEMIRYHPWTGVGFSNYEPTYSQYALMNWPLPLGHAHNYYLNVTAELGIPGLLAYLLLWGAILWQTMRALRRHSGWRHGLALGLLGAWTHLSVHHLFDNLYVNNTHLLIGALLGVLTALNLD